MKIIFGLGNSEKRYDRTRHNVGFDIIDFFANDNDLKFKDSSKFYAHIAEFTSDLQNAIITQGFLIRNYDSQKKYLISSTLPISKVGTMIYNIEGTNDYTGLTINGSTSNLVIPYNKIIVIVSVVINNYVEI